MGKFHSCTVFCASGEFYFKQKSPCALITSSTLAHVQYWQTSLHITMQVNLVWSVCIIVESLWNVSPYRLDCSWKSQGACYTIWGAPLVSAPTFDWAIFTQRLLRLFFANADHKVGTDVWQHKPSVTSWTYGAFLSVFFHCCHPSRCQSPACCHEWLMGLADSIFCNALMSLAPWLLGLILSWAYEIIMLLKLHGKLLYTKPIFLLP